MKYLDINCALKLHDDIIREIGGLAGYDALRLNYLSSAVVKRKKKGVPKKRTPETLT